MSYADLARNTRVAPLQPTHGTNYASTSERMAPSDHYLNATLERIDQIANEDVEMRAPLLEAQTFVVIDTNVLLHHYDVLQQFVNDSEAISLPVTLVIPGIVIQELDGQKNRDGLGWFARRASSWLLTKVRERKFVKGQAREETCKASKNWKVRDLEEEYGDRVNDHLVIDCALYYQRAGRRVFLCSADRNLCFDGEAANIPTISPSNRWSSRELAQAIFGDSVPATAFGVFHASYRGSTGSKPPPTVDDDGMDVDDEVPTVSNLPSHALDLLHLQIVEHFTALLVELVSRVAGPEVLHKPGGDGASSSRYAPTWAKKHYLEWTAAECIDYLGTKKHTKDSSPRMGVFLSYPYVCPGSGARRGQDWSRKDWIVALEALQELGNAWNETSIRESLTVLQPHLTAVFEEPMRPTGIGNSFR